MKKKLLAIGLGAALSMTAVSAMADYLTLTNNLGSTITVLCRGIPALPINVGTPRVIEYKYLNIYGSRPICKFYLNNYTTQIGIAQIYVASGNTQAQVLSAASTTGYSATVTDQDNGTTYQTPITTSTPEANNMSVTFNN
ncbi:MAG TPA: hypothetical protein VJK30_05865 [Coxiellaceae bacterium]|nr:MAG: hypothetical protein A3E81_06335 [Gammaproteobacteria bacterium RIFCSPHIGHO2_12_FULL_36_30]HLB56837.1 hypothetical protein [Coxiellaceae bacterium]